ncbi:hypothetical protein H6P81_018543 [Aristolochia fimbriata]|uniref:Uncharacterized protein n=1 Tax=Aristolochia fimbriata TaxID=158543 RepID=A0AAV7E3C4_ARIFI|nr:hypothetical protein H6P81_018543 [Aristolochia fimbriata]
METMIYTEKAISGFKNPRRNVRSSENLVTPEFNLVSSIRGGLVSSSFSSFPSFNAQQPPLLPLPIARSVSFIPPTQRFGKTKPQINLTPKKPKSASSGGNQKVRTGGNQSKTAAGVVDPAALPARVLKARSLQIDLDDFSGSIFSLSPHPSSLPLPKFSLQPKAKIRCNAEASEGIDAGATDNLRRLLRLR